MNDSPLPLEVMGKWWLPETPDRAVGGVLTFAEDSGGQLRLAGSLREFNAQVEWAPGQGDGERRGKITTASRQRAGTYPRVHGEADGKYFTLEDCFQTSVRSQVFGEPWSETVHVNAVIRGALFGADEALEFDGCALSISHLTAWVGRSGLSMDVPCADDGEFAVIRARTLPPIRASLSEDCELILGQWLRQAGDHVHELRVEQETRCRLESQGLRSLETFSEIASDIQDLLTIATGETSNISSFVFQHPDVPSLTIGGTPTGRAPLDYLVQWTNRSPTPKTVPKHTMFFTFEDLGGVDGLVRWLRTVTPLRSELGRVMATRYSRAMYLEDRVSNCVAALESLDRERRQDKVKDLAVRLRRCADLAGEPFAVLVGDLEGWIATAKRHRDDLAHHYARLWKQTSTLQFELAEELYWLFALCTLRLADAPDAVFDSILKHQRFQWLADRKR